MQYIRKEKDIVEAVQFIGPVSGTIKDQFNEFPNWLRQAFEDNLLSISSDFVRVFTIIEGERLNASDWLIQKLEGGAFFHCNDELFKLRYENNKNIK
jgi:hypothetical protein